MENNENYSCVDCIWHDQCESDVPCEFFDMGHSADSLTDDEVEVIIEANRQEYKKEYPEYISEFSDGNIDPSDILEPNFDEKENEMECSDDLS